LYPHDFSPVNELDVYTHCSRFGVSCQWENAESPTLKFPKTLDKFPKIGYNRFRFRQSYSTEGKMPVINKETGLPPTEQEQHAIDAQAIIILSSPYSAPERIAWAIDCASLDVVEDWFFNQWESCREHGRKDRHL
jgi:hypothetical protein